MYVSSNGEHAEGATISYYEQARDAFVGDATTELAAMMIDHARESHEIQNAIEESEEAWLDLVQKDEIEALRDQADELRSAGKWQGACMVVSGGFQVASAATQPSGDASNANAPKDAAGANAANGAAGTPSSEYLAGGSPGAQGVGEWAHSIYEFRANRARTDATEFEHLGEEAKRRLDSLNEERSNTTELTRAALDHLRSVQETQAAIDRSLTSWRA